MRRARALRPPHCPMLSSASGAPPGSGAILAAASSSMSLLAASVTKSCVVGLMPSVELTPVFSPMDWACARGASKISAADDKANLFL